MDKFMIWFLLGEVISFVALYIAQARSDGDYSIINFANGLLETFRRAPKTMTFCMLVNGIVWPFYVYLCVMPPEVDTMEKSKELRNLLDGNRK